MVVGGLFVYMFIRLGINWGEGMGARTAHGTPMDPREHGGLSADLGSNFGTFGS